MASNCLEKGSELLFGHCALISSEWKLPKGGSHYQKRQSAKNSFDVGIVLHYHLKNLSCCKPCPQCNMSYIFTVFSVFSTSVCPCYCRVHGRCSGGKKLIVFEDPWTLKAFWSASLLSNFCSDNGTTLCASNHWRHRVQTRDLKHNLPWNRSSWGWCDDSWWNGSGVSKLNDDWNDHVLVSVHLPWNRSFCPAFEALPWVQNLCACCYSAPVHRPAVSEMNASASQS